jgi:hypothetical protein
VATPFGFCKEFLRQKLSAVTLHMVCSTIDKRKNPSHPRKSTEATATRWLEFRVFQGVGSKFLGWQFPEYEILEDDTEKLVVLPGPRC